MIGIPFLKKLINKLNDVFEPIYKERIELDTSDIEVLQPNYRDKAEWMTLAGVFTDNEIRTATSFDKLNSEVSDKTPNELTMGNEVAGYDKDELGNEVISGNKPVITEDIQSLALNGAQIASLLEVINNITTGLIPLNNGRAIIEAAFHSLTEAQLNNIMANLGNFKPKVTE